MEDIHCNLYQQHDNPSKGGNCKMTSSSLANSSGKQNPNASAISSVMHEQQSMEKVIPFRLLGLLIP